MSYPGKPDEWAQTERQLEVAEDMVEGLVDLLRRLVDMAGPQPGTVAWAADVGDALAEAERLGYGKRPHA